MKEHEPEDLPEKDSPLGWTHDLVGPAEIQREEASAKEGLQENLSIHSVARCY